MRTCFVPFCDIKNKDQPNRTMFLVPKQPRLFAQWAKVLPKVRTLRSTDKVCYVHFRPDDIVYSFEHCINGKIYKIKRDRPKLKPNSLPCLEMTTKEELLSYRVKTRLPSNSKVIVTSDEDTLFDNINELITVESGELNSTANNISDQILEENFDSSATVVNVSDDTIADFDNHEQVNNNESENQFFDLILEESNNVADNNSENMDKMNSMNLFNSIYDNTQKLLLPNTLWGTHRCPDRSMICFSYMTITTMQITKMVCVKNDGSMQLFFNGKALKTLKLLHDVEDLYSLSTLLNKVDMWSLCFCNKTNPNCEIIVEPNDKNTWNTDCNEQVLICKSCVDIIEEK